MTSRPERLPEILLDHVRQALAACAPGLDVSAVRSDTPLGALFFDSLMAVSFIARLEAMLSVSELPFESWLREHSERTDFLTVGGLVDWLSSLDPVRAAAREEAQHR
jgi:acyl carrier protein